jgi:Periplasmic copper-binding protein (NosD)
MLKIPALSTLFLCALAHCLPFEIPRLEPSGQTLRVRTVSELTAAIASAKKGQTLLLADGTYDLGPVEPLRLRTDSVTLYGESRDPSKVIFKGQGFKSANINEEMIKIEASSITLAYLTLSDVRANGLKIQTGANHNLLVHNVHFIDICERSIKSPEAPVSLNGEIRYCLFEQKTPITSDIPNLNSNGDYIAGMDMMRIEGWKIHHNVFRNIRGMNGGGRAGVFLWKGCKNITVEANVFSGCDRGIAFGNPGSNEPDMTGGVIRNNFIIAGVDIAIEICNASQTLIAHNSVYSKNPTFNRTLSFYASGSGNVLSNNLVMGKLAVLTGTAPTASGNMLVTSLDAAKNWFVNPDGDDLHLPAGSPAADKGIPVPQVTDDIDGNPRDANPDVGADEFGNTNAIKPGSSPTLKRKGASTPLRTPTIWFAGWKSGNYLAHGARIP